VQDPSEHDRQDRGQLSDRQLSDRQLGEPS
jgi:hypothetical protein